MENLRNQAYIDDLTKNAMGGTIKCIERGLYPGGNPPYGYKSVGRKDNRHFEFDGDKAEYMRAAFEIEQGLEPVFYENRKRHRPSAPKISAHTVVQTQERWSFRTPN